MASECLVHTGLNLPFQDFRLSGLYLSEQGLFLINNEYVIYKSRQC